MDTTYSTIANDTLKSDLPDQYKVLIVMMCILIAAASQIAVNTQKQQNK